MKRFASETFLSIWDFYQSLWVPLAFKGWTSSVYHYKNVKGILQEKRALNIIFWVCFQFYDFLV